MFNQRRCAATQAPRTEATGRTVGAEAREFVENDDMLLSDIVRAGGLLSFTPKEVAA